MLSCGPVSAKAVATAPKELANSSAKVPRIDGKQDRERHHPPVLEARGAQDRRGLAPFALQPVKRGRDDQDHQRDLEEQVGEDQPPCSSRLKP
jgi:hypothetical protein